MHKKEDKPLRILLGGSPCTKWSICQRKNRETTNEGIGWELFLNYVIAKEKFQPDYFLYENNNSISTDIKNEISKSLGQPIQMIDAALVSAQQRKRIWVHNIPNVSIPKDKGLCVKDILDYTLDLHKVKLELLDSYYWKGGFSKENIPTLVGMIKNNGTYLNNGKQPSQQYRIYSSEKKGICLNTGKSTSGLYIYKIDKEVKGYTYRVQNKKIMIDNIEYDVDLIDGLYVIRYLTPVEVERMQTLPDNYTQVEGVTDTQRYKMLGNGWCAEIPKLILSGIDIPKDYPIEVLSLYDGLGTGRYVLDKLGFTNVVYKAYEIDKYAMKVASYNYPDIIQCGDAFTIRENNWDY